MSVKPSILLLILLFAFACGKDEPTETIIPQEDFLGEVGELEEDTTDTEDLVFAGEITPVDALAMTLEPEYDTIALNEFHMLDRYESSTKRKLTFKSKKTVPYGETARLNPTAEVYYYTFSDSLKTKNAFYNWLDCFGSDCNAVSLNEDVDAIKTPPLTTWVYDTTIVVVNYMCEHAENDWQSFEDSLVTYTGKSYTFNIKVECGGPLKWK